MTDSLLTNTVNNLLTDEHVSDVLNDGAIGSLNAELPTETEELPEEEKQEEGVNPLQEVASAVGGGAIDAVESVGGFAELTGDTIKTGLNQLLGKATDDSQNPFSNEYSHGDANWLQIPDEITDSQGNVL